MRISPRVKPALAIPEAISRFDLRRQKRFSTYLAHRLRGAITAATREHRRSSIFDKTQYFPDKQETPAEWSEIQPRSAGDFWSPQVIRWARRRRRRSEEHTSELQSRQYLVCRLLLEKKKESVFRGRNCSV